MLTAIQSDLSFTCKCSNGTDITSSLENYQQSVPGLMCRYWFDACINATGTDASAQFQCISARDTKCGNLTVDDNGDSSSSASASASSSASKTSGGSSSSSTASASASTSSTGAAANLAFFGTPVLAGGLLAVFGLAL